jgi:glycosyltransferase involved in cell wall biosynthesis
MKVLFLHQNFPAQYRHLVRRLANGPENEVYFITQANANAMQGVTKIVYQPVLPAQSTCHPFSLDVDRAIRTGLAAAEACRALRARGIRPDIVIGHNGWGETLFVKDVFPDAPLLSYFEFFYHAHGVDLDFDPEFISVFGDPARLRTRNAVNLMGFNAADWGHTATSWQRSLYPADMRRRITAIHEGVDTTRAKPYPDAWLALPGHHRKLTRDDEVITYVARNLEPYRGFHVFMRALPEILRRRPRAHVIVVGGDGVSYGTPPPIGASYREWLQHELRDSLDWARVHFLGQLPYETYLRVLQVSSAHVYLTYPFVLSWSFAEALACGCLVIGSKTPPVLEVLRDRVNGLLVDFFSACELADRVDEVFDQPDRLQALRDRARQTAVRRFDLTTLQLPKWERLVDDLVNGRRPATDMNRPNFRFASAAASGRAHSPA